MPNASVPAAATGSPGLSRRALFAAAPAVLLAGSAVAAPAFGLQQLIDAHRAAWEAAETADAHAFDVMVTSYRPEEERVQYGRNAGSKQPLYVHSDEDIERISHPMFGSRAAIFGDPDGGDAKRRRWVDDKILELRGIEERNQRHRDAIGLTVAWCACDDADELERAARLELILYRPASPAEEAARRAYMASSLAFRNTSTTGCRDIVTALFDRLGIPLS